MKVLGTPKPSLQWFKDDLEVGNYFIISRLETNLCSQVFSSDRLEIKDEEDGGSVIVREARSTSSQTSVAMGKILPGSRQKNL